MPGAREQRRAGRGHRGHRGPAGHVSASRPEGRGRPVRVEGAIKAGKHALQSRPPCACCVATGGCALPLRPSALSPPYWPVASALPLLLPPLVTPGWRAPCLAPRGPSAEPHTDPPTRAPGAGDRGRGGRGDGKMWVLRVKARLAGARWREAGRGRGWSERGSEAWGGVGRALTCFFPWAAFVGARWRSARGPLPFGREACGAKVQSREAPARRQRGPVLPACLGSAVHAAGCCSCPQRFAPLPTPSALADHRGRKNTLQIASRSP